MADVKTVSVLHSGATGLVLPSPSLPPPNFPAARVSLNAVAGLVSGFVQGAIAELAASVTALDSGTVKTTGDQTIIGLKTFNGGIAGSQIQLNGATAAHRLVSGLGAGASDVLVKLGSSVADGSVNASAKLVSVRSGIGGSEVEKFAVLGNGNANINGLEVGSFASLISYGVIKIGASIGFCIAGGGGYLLFNTANGDTTTLHDHIARTYKSGTANWGFGAYMTNGAMYGAAGKVALASGSAGPGASDVCAQVGTNIGEASCSASAKLFSVAMGIGGTVAEKVFVIKDGTVELTGTGVGIVMKSPDGTRYRATIANGGTWNIAAA